MKRLFIFFIVFTFFAGHFLNAMDLIILRDGNVIEARVVEISATEIRYRRIDHLDGPIIVISVDRVLSIRYENGRIEVFEATQQTPAVTQPNIPTQVQPSIPVTQANQLERNPRLNTIGATLGYQGISAFGFTVNGTVSPANYTFFDFNLGLGFNSFAFTGRVNFNAFVPFNTGGWYAGIGIVGGYNELFGGVIAGNITTGFLLFNWLNIAYTLQIGNFDNIVNHNIAVGYSFRFSTQENSVTNMPHTVPISSSVIASPPAVPRVIKNYTVLRVTGEVQRGVEGIWVDIRVGDILTSENFIRTARNSILVLMDDNNNTTVTIPGGTFHNVGFLVDHFRRN